MKRAVRYNLISPGLAALIFATAGIAAPARASLDRAPAPRDGSTGDISRHHEGGDPGAGTYDSGTSGSGDHGGGSVAGDSGAGSGDHGGGTSGGGSGGGDHGGGSGGGGGDGGGTGGGDGGTGGGGGSTHGTPAPLAGIGFLALAALGYGSRKLRRQPPK